MPTRDPNDSGTRPKPGAEFEEKYGRSRSQKAREVVRSVLGTDLPNGYTTLEQADLVSHGLDLAPVDLLLDLGAGRGWPGSRIAAASGCRLFCTDLPMEVLTSARQGLARMDLAHGPSVLSADGSALPFASSSFHGVVHADVLC